MKKYHKYGHYKKKKWPSCTLQFIIDFCEKYKKKGTEVDIWIEPAKYTEPLVLCDCVYLEVDRSVTQEPTPQKPIKPRWPPKINQFAKITPGEVGEVLTVDVSGKFIYKPSEESNV